MRTIAGLTMGSMLLLSATPAHATAAASFSYDPGVTVRADPNSPTGQTATFVYENNDPTISKVVLYSDTFKLWDEAAPQYTNGPDGPRGMNLNDVSPADQEAYGHLPQEYRSSYWPGGGSASSRLSLELTKVAGDDVWSTQVPLMSGAFVYNYEITRDGVTTSRLDDPANPALVNTATGVRSLSSVVHVPYDPRRQGRGAYRDRSIENPRTDGRTGVVRTVTYPAADQTNRGMSVYLPYGYDPDRTEPYDVLYINMGNSGDQFGNELRWMNEGSLPNIADNLIARGKEPFIAVSVNYQDWRHDFTRIEPDVLDHVLPYVESRYNVSTTREGRGYAGLSAGAGTTARFYLNHPDKFSQFGIWSNGITPTTEQLAEIAQYRDSTSVHIALGKWDYVTGGRAMSQALTANGVPHTFTEIPGGHDWEFWQLMLADFARDHLWVDDQSSLDVSVTARPEHHGKGVRLSASATNEDSVPVRVAFTTAYGTRTFQHVKPGRTVDVSFDTRLASVSAGEVSVQVTGKVGGEPITTTKTAPYAAFPAAS